MPRVIAGTARGTHLKTPKGLETRPTTDQVKEAFFSIIQFQLAGKTLLDLFAGSGQIGIEAISRGAERAVLVEQGRKQLACIKDNIKTTGFRDQIKLLPFAAEKALVLLEAEGQNFDFIYLDPPWQHASKHFEQQATKLAGLLKQDGWLILEHSALEVINSAQFALQKHYRYGSSQLSFFNLAFE